MDSGENLILICVDESEHSLRAFNWYTKYFNRKEHVVGLLQIYTGYSREEMSEDEYHRRLHDKIKRKEALSLMFHNLCTEKGIKSCVITEEKIESVGHTICKIAKETSALSIVMGQRGMGKVKRTIFGSVSDFVLRNAGVPVMIVPPPKA